MTLTVGSLFSGIGGLDLGLERAGMNVIWQSEIDPYCNKVLKKHWPEVTNHGNIKDIDWGTVQRPDIICGGYPCQPFSTAGKRKGTDDPRHLWPWVRDAISALRPKYAILENVRGHVSMGGLQVIGELAEIGYDAEWEIVSAASQGAPHVRERLFILAYPQRQWNGQHRQSTDVTDVGKFWRTDDRREKGNERGEWWSHQPNLGRVVYGVPNRVDKLRGLGNAVVPQVAEYIGRLVMAAELQNS